MNKDVLLGTIIGDIAGSRFELVNNKYGKEFEFLHKFCRYTDDLVMTLAVAKTFLEAKEDYSNLEEHVIKSMTEVGRKYLSSVGIWNLKKDYYLKEFIFSWNYNVLWCF